MTGPGLAITPLAPVSTAAVFCRLGGALWATVVVKATFQLVHGESARLIAAEELIAADRPAAPGGSVERARETAPHLPNAGVLLSGHACAPGGRAVPSMSVRLGVSRDRPLVDRTLHVFGARSPAAPGAVTPFIRMPIVYERAFGGSGVPENPVGTGGPGSAGSPNIVDPRDARRPAGFGPVAAEWAPRRGHTGGLDAAALGAAVLEPPPGFDWRFFQAAPADQQLDRLRGDEWIVLDGMSPSHPRVQSRLPQVTALARRRVVSEGAVAEQAIELRADMLVIDADRLIASLVWRGRFPVASVEALRAMRVLVGLERPGEPVRWPAAEAPAAPGKGMSSETTDVDLAAILGAKVPFAPPRPPGPGVAPARGSAGVRTHEGAGVPGRESAGVPGREGAGVPGREDTAVPPGETPLSTGTQEVSLAAILGAKVPFSPASGGPPASISPAPDAPRRTPMSTGTTDVNLAELLKGAALHRGAAAGPAPGTPPQAAASVPAPVSPAVIAASVPAPVSPSAAAASVPVPVPPAVVAASVPVPAPPAVVAASVPVPVPPAPASSAPALDTPPSPEAPPPAAPTPPRSEPVRPPAPSPAALARKRAIALLGSGQPFDGEDFAGANLSGLDLSARSLVRCDLRGATLRGANLRGAALAGACLDEADLRGAILDEADLQNASLVRADLERARLSRCNGAGARLCEARLTGADLRQARFPEASFEGADLRAARGDGADLAGARLDRADLSASSFRDARLAAAVLAFATLDHADLRRADLAGANLHEARRRMTRLAGADLAGTVETPPPPGDAAGRREP